MTNPETAKRPIEEVFIMFYEVMSRDMAKIVLIDRAAYEADEDAGVLAYRSMYIDSGAVDTQELKIDQKSVESELELMVKKIMRYGYSKVEALEFLAKRMIHLQNPSEKAKKKRQSA